MIDVMDEKVREEIALQVAKIQKDRVEDAIKAAQEIKVDFLNIGSKIEIQTPVKFQKMQQSWEDIFPDLEMNVKVKTTLTRTYDTGQPIDIKGSEA